MSWIGDARGLLGSAVIFALAHFVSGVGQLGFRYPMHLAEVCLRTLAGGLLLGYVYLRSKNIYPGSILHISGNMYVGRIIEVFSP